MISPRSITMRRPRRHAQALTSTPSLARTSLTPAYIPPAPVLLCIATLSVAAFRNLLSGPLSTLSERIQRFREARRPKTLPQVAINQLLTRLETVGDRAKAGIDAHKLVIAPPTHEQFLKLAPVQRRELLANAIATAVVPDPQPPILLVQRKVEPVKESVVVETPSRMKRFLAMAESVNGRAAAVGFILCLTREIAEPGHPSLFEQVVDVVVPIAQKTPPLLVAFVDRLVDLVT